MFWYAVPGSADPTLGYTIGERRPDGLEPPGDESVFRRTPEGTRFVERRDEAGLVTGLDFWDDAHHYLVSLQGAYGHSSPEHARAVALIDSAQ